MMDGPMADIIERYLHAIASHDWDVVDECIADDIVRAGPTGTAMRDATNISPSWPT
jgi:ketosteroid isomerase-like protein